MKKLAIATVGLAVLSTSAFATKARLEALGQSANGSQFIDDNRNVFLNPSHLNTHYDFVTMEWGATTQGNTPDVDASATPKAEGGMFKNNGNIIYGVYFGQESDTSHRLRAAAGVTGNAAEEMNNLDLFVAGDAGVQWGVRLTHGSYMNDNEDANGDGDTADAADGETEATQTRMTVGVVSGNVDAFLNFGLANTAEDGASEFDGAGSIDLGVTYAAGDMDVILRYSSISAEDGNDNEFTSTATSLGVAKNYKLNDKAQMWASAFYSQSVADCEFTTTSSTDGCFLAQVGTGETTITAVPVVVGVEVMAREWLTLRGSVSHRILGTTELDNGDESTIADSTTVNAGASLTFGDFNIDGLIGNSAGGANASATDTSVGDGNLRTDNLMSRVSMTYKF